MVFCTSKKSVFYIGKLAKDLVADYSKRKGWTLEEGEKWLGLWRKGRSGWLLI